MSNPIPDTPECVAHHLGLYACEPQRFQALYSALLSGQLRASSEEEFEERRKAPVDYEITSDGIALIPIRGVMQRAESKFGDACSTVRVRRCMRMAAEDDAVRGVAFVLDTPGGAVAGQTELVDDLERLKEKKPTCAIINELACSAGYWFASGCGRLYASRLAQLGNIGCYTVAVDETGRLERDGIKLVTVSSGKYKGLGADGAVTPELVEEMSARVAVVHAEFVGAVADGRNLPREAVEPLADGRCFSAAEALNLKLIDAVANYDDALADFATTINPQEEEEMNVPDDFLAMADQHGYDFAKANFGKSAEEVALALRDRELAAVTAERDELAQKLSNTEAELAKLKEERGAPPAGFNPPKPDAAKKSGATYHGKFANLK